MVSTQHRKRFDLGWIKLPVLVAGLALTGMVSAAAQTATIVSSPLPAPAPAPAAQANDTAIDVNDVDGNDADANEASVNDPAMKDVDVNNLDWSQLNVDASTLGTGSAARKTPPGPASTNGGMAWSATDKANGSSAVSAKQSLSEFLDTRVGVDMNVARQPSTLTEAQLLDQKLANGGSLPQSSGTAWAAITAPGVGQIWDKTAVEARVDPGQDQSKVGTSLSKSIPINPQYSITLENGYSVLEQGVTPMPGLGGRTSRNYETDQSAKLSVTDTGTSVVAGQSLSTTDDKWLRKIGAEQKLFGGVTISGSVGETTAGSINKSVTAGYKQSW